MIPPLMEGMVGASMEECWEALVARGAIPESWLDDPLRRFTGHQLDMRIGHAFLPMPPAPRMMVLAAEQQERLLMVEAAVRETVTHLRGPNASTHPVGIVWACWDLGIPIDALSRWLVGNPENPYRNAVRTSGFWPQLNRILTTMDIDEKTRRLHLRGNFHESYMSEELLNKVSLLVGLCRGGLLRLHYGMAVLHLETVLNDSLSGRQNASR